MRNYTDSADAIKAYGEEVDFDFSKVNLIEHSESEEYNRGGLTLEFKTYSGDDMKITIIHNWSDRFDVTFKSENKKDTLNNIYAGEIMGLLDSVKLALTGISHEEWTRILKEEGKL